MLFLPDYYGFDINDSLPILSINRIMYFIFYIYVIFNHRRAIDIHNIKLNTIPRFYYYLGGYFIFRCFTNLYYVTSYNQAVKTLFLIIFQQLFLLIAIYFLAPTKDELHRLIKIVIYTAAFLFLLGIFESYSSVRITDELYTVSRDFINEHYVRFGLLRATTTFYMPVMYGNMCVLMFPIIMYMYNIERQKKYLAFTVLCILAIIHSGSRADIIFIFPIVVIYSLTIIRNSKRRLLFCKNTVIVIVSLLLLITLPSLLNTHYRYFYVGTAKSVLNEFGCNYDLDVGAPETVTGFDEKAIKGNSSGSMSRLTQFTGMKYVAKINPIFGLGSGAQMRGDVQYLWNGKWKAIPTYDVGYVAVFCDEGIIGIIAFILLALALLYNYRTIIMYSSAKSFILIPITYSLSKW